MNPRHRRLLIPGLLILLLIVVVVSSLVSKASGAEAKPEVVSRIADARVVESSGLAVSRRQEDLAYTINDSGNAPIVYAVQISTGAVIGTTTITGGSLVDTEAIGIDGRGTIWIADTGDNRAKRNDVALYALPEPGQGDHTVEAERYPLSYDIGPTDVESLVVNPRTGAKYLITKEPFAGRVIDVPDSLRTDGTNELTTRDVQMPMFATDATTSEDGRYAIVRTYLAMSVYDISTWKLVDAMNLPRQKQGESISMERSGRSVLIGSEGVNSALLRVPVIIKGAVSPVPTPTATAATADPESSVPPPGGNGFAGATWFWALLVLALLGAISVAATRSGGRPR